MRVRLQVVIETDDGQVQDVQDVFQLHRGELMERLGIHGTAGLVRYAIRVGLVRAES